MMNKKLFLLPLLVLMLASAGSAQEYITGFNHGGTYPESKVSRPDNEPLSLPFFDDFSGSGIYPDESRWQTNNVFVNSGFPYMPVNHGTATLDVVNRFGVVYPNGSSNPFLADSLMSCPIRLDSINGDALSPADSLYFSFYYQPGGFGDCLSIRTVVTKPIKFIGTGEKMEAIDVFHPARMADRILGMGDVVSLVERAQEQFDLEEAKKLEKKIRKNQFDFNDFYNQIQQIKKMGNIKDLAAMIPGVGKAIRDVDIPEDAFKGIEAIILSMTPKERTNPAILNTSRRQRIAKGSGTNIQEVNKLIKQFDQTRKMMQMMTGNKMAQMMSRMKGMPGMPKMPGM